MHADEDGCEIKSRMNRCFSSFDQKHIHDKDHTA